jgi:hypothetical protein
VAAMPGAVDSHMGCAEPGNLTSNQHATPWTVHGPLQVNESGITMFCRSASCTVVKSMGRHVYGDTSSPGSNESITTLPQ